MGSNIAEHVTVCAHWVIPHEQFASEGSVVEVLSEIAHRPLEVLTLLEDVSCELFLRKLV